LARRNDNHDQLGNEAYEKERIVREFAAECYSFGRFYFELEEERTATNAVNTARVDFSHLSHNVSFECTVIRPGQVCLD